MVACSDDDSIGPMADPMPFISEHYILEAQPSSNLELEGRDLDHVERVTLNGQELVISNKSEDKLTITLPETVTSGLVTITFGEETIDRFLKVIDNSFSSTNLEFDPSS